MRIAVVVCTFPPYRGGMGNAAYNEAKELAKLGEDVTVLTPKYDYKQIRDEVMDGIRVKRLAPVFKYGNAAFLPELFWILKDYDCIYLHYPFYGGAEVIWISRILHEFSTNIKRIFTRMFLKREATFGKRPKVVIRYHMDVRGKGLLGLIFKIHTKILMPRILKAGNRVIVSSSDYANHNDACELVDDRWVEIPFGVDLKRFDSNVLEFRSNGFDKLTAGISNEFKKEGEKIVLFVGALDKAHYFKGVDFLLEAFSLLKDKPYKLIIVGEGHLRPYYESLAKKLGIAEKVIFVGAPSDRDLPNYYNLADVVVLPSIDKSEAFGLVLLEAMACAKPVIASNLAGVRSVVSDGVNGFLVKPKNIGELANSIDYVLIDSQLARDLGEMGRRKVEQYYNWERLGKDLSRILHE